MHENATDAPFLRGTSAATYVALSFVGRWYIVAVGRREVENTKNSR